MTSHPFIGYLLALTAAILWGISGTAGQVLFVNKGLDVGWLISFRLLIASMLLLGYLSLQKGKAIFAIWRSPKDCISMLVFGIVGVFMMQYAYFMAIKQSNAATATVLQYIAPVFVVFYYTLKNQQIPQKIELIALACATIGVFFLATHGNPSSLAITPSAFLWGMCAAVTLAIYSIQPISMLKSHSATLVVGWGMLVGGIFSSFIAPPWEITGVWDIETLLLSLFIAIFGTLIAYFAYLSAIKRIGATTTSMLGCAEPLAAILIAVGWLGVQFIAYDWIGSTFIILTLMVLFLGKRKPKLPL